ncbi:sulfotransferase domain-containing protein [Psychroserpens sp. Hel_I_66]|uniref:sulfotransferase domain-containing protein n=1 Tax=Psychroserpens sp. Hel_I_66 TaxID=1250004 RepID=UPI0006482BDC|nr:sulfotransferase domain-containing protein [Psychroserpens sp. Hel_I_66]
MEKLKTNNFPNLFIPGAAKSGTSTLYDLLNQHPEISMSSTKEPFYMVHEDFDSKINLLNSKYKELFNTEDTIKYRGDASTAYMLFPNFIERAKTQLNFQKKFIFILRNPVDRIYSAYWYIKGLGSESLDFKNAVLKDIHDEPSIKSMLPEGKFKHYFQYGLYGKWIKRFYDNFDSKDIKIILFEDLKEDPLKIANECFRFLNLYEIDSIDEFKSNETIILKYPYIHKNAMKIIRGKVKFLKPLKFIIPKKFKIYIKNNVPNLIISKTKSNKKYPKLSTEERNWLAELYKDDFLVLQKKTNLDFRKWKDFHQDVEI